MRKQIIRLLVASVATLATTVWADPAPAPAKAPTAQQTRMAQCNKEAGDKKGDERKAFMRECLSAKKHSQQDKMTACNKEAGDKKGDERKAFMKECLSR